MDQTLIKKLIEAGMSEAEAAVYVSLLSRPSMNTKEIADVSEIPRSTVVLALDKLTRTGVVDVYTYGKRRNFVVRSVNDIERYINDEEKQIQARKANLGKLAGSLRQYHFLTSSNGMELKILKGEDEYKNLYLSTLDLKPGEEILRINVESEKFIFFRDFFKRYSQQKNKRKIKTRLLLPDSALSRGVADRDKKNLRETRFLPKKIYNPDAAIAIWADNVSFTVWDENLETTVIKSKQIVDNLKAIFELLWINAKK